MKGTTIIELTDKQGRVERTIDHNYVTNALKYYFKNGGELNPSPFGSSANGDWIYNLLGGVMLFDGKMEDDEVVIAKQASSEVSSNDYEFPLDNGQTVTLYVLAGTEGTDIGWSVDVYQRLTSIINGKEVYTADEDHVIFSQDGGTKTYTASQDCVVKFGLRTLNGGSGKIVISGVGDNPEIIEPPLGVHMTANGVRGVLNSGDPTELGSWNETESGWQEDGTYRMVWDWTTSQGNGTIKSVSLAPRLFAFEGIGNKSLSKQSASPSLVCGHYNNARSRSETGAPVAMWDNVIWTMDGRNRVRYYPQQDTINISNLTEMTFHQYHLAMSEVELRGQAQYDDITISLPQAMQNTTMYIRRWQQRKEHLYLLCGASDAYDATYYILDINLMSKAVAQTYTVVPSTLGSQASDGRLMGINDIYFFYNDVCINYKTNTAVSVAYTTANPSAVISMGDRFYTSTNGFSVNFLDCIDPSTGEAYPVNLTSADNDYESVTYNNTQIWNIGYSDELLYYVYYNWTRYRSPRFLATVNNLDQSVTKTADKTMKVIYTLDFSEEEAS